MSGGAFLAKYGCYDQNGSMLLPPAFGTYGTMARGRFRGIGLKLVDFSVTKDTRFSDRFNGQFRFEVFNILNMTQYSPSVTGATTSTTSFGSSTATPDVGVSDPTIGSGASRSVELGFKLTF